MGMTVALVAALALAAALAPHPAGARARTGSLTHHVMPAGATYPSREYYRYLPPRLAPPPRRALVVYLHGCTQPAIEAAKGVRWNELADEHGFVVVYPDQRVPQGLGDNDGSAARCWNPGQAETTPRGSGEIATIAEITRSVAREHRVHPGRVYVTGISGGAMMATTMAVVYPDLYAAVGHVENCGYVCADATGELAHRRMGEHARVVPAMLVAGTADFLINPAMSESAVTQWLGTNDLADDGQRNGSVPYAPTATYHDVPPGTPSPSVPGTLCVQIPRDRNPCPGGVIGPYPVTRREYAQRSSGRVVVEAWTIHGLSHNYPGGNPEGSHTDPFGPNITPPLFEFFQEHARL